MKLKLDDNGNAVLRDGKPVYVNDDGSEIAFDAPAAMTKIGELNAESANHRRSAKELKTQVAAFGDLDPAKAREALQTVQNLDDKKLIDAGEVEKVKKQMGDVFSQEKTSLQEQLSGKDKQIRTLTVSAKFGQSTYLTEKTVLTPDIAEKAFGDNFKVEETEGGVKIVPELNGAPIFSRERPGEVANFDEAIATIINARPDKDRLLRNPGHGGSGAGGGQGSGNGTTNPFKDGTRTEQAALIKSDAVTAKRLANEAGVEIPGLNA